MGIKKFTLLSLIICSLTGCTVEQPALTNPVTWYAINGWSDTVQFDLYDEVCERFMRDLRLRPGYTVPVTSCGNEEGRAAIRYRRERIAAVGQPWTSQNSITPNQEVFLR